jgi:hypothetical protein
MPATVGADAPAEPGESVACRGVRLSASFALPRSQSTPRARQSAAAHRISRWALFLAAEKRRKTRKIAWGRECSVFSNRNARHRWGGCFCRAGGISGVPDQPQLRNFRRRGKQVARAFLTPRTKVARKFAAAAHKKRVLAPRGGVSVISISILRYADNLFIPDLPSSLFSTRNHRLSLHFLAVITYLNSSQDVPS